MTHNDINPSIVCGFFGHPDKLDETIKAIHGHGSLRVREIRFVDIGISLEDDKFEDDLNFLKSFTRPMLARIINSNFPFQNAIFKKAGLTPVKYPKEMWASNPKLFCYSGFTPLFVDESYKKSYPKNKQKNLNKLIHLHSDSFKDHEEQQFDKIKAEVEDGTD